MAIWTLEQLPIFLVAFLPGFISVKVYDLLVPGDKRDFSKSIFEVVGYSALNFAGLVWLLLPAFLGDWSSTYPKLFYLTMFASVFIFPILWPVAIVRLVKTNWLSRYVIDPTPTAWDYVFGKREAYFVTIHLKDGRRIGGWYGKESYASSYPSPQEVYLESVWELNDEGRFKAEIQDSAGIIVFSNEIAMLELHQPGD